MAVKATVFKAELQVSDMDRHYYQDHAVTLARHPSETDERMMVRLLAFALPPVIGWLVAGLGDVQHAVTLERGRMASAVEKIGGRAGALERPLILAAPASPTWTASGGGFTFRYVILYNLSLTQCIGYWDYGTAVVMNGTNADTFTPTLDAVNGVFTVA